VSGRAQRTPAYGKGLVFSLESFLQDQLAQRRLGHRLLQALVLTLEILKALGLVELEATVFTPPAIVALLRDIDASTHRADRLTLAQPNFSTMICSLVNRVLPFLLLIRGWK
jgi:hypothetical protein